MLRVAALALVVTAMPAGPAAAQSTGSKPTFAKDVAPILQRSCQNCHRPNSVAPMSLITYEEVRPWARSIKQRTGLGDKMGLMPPWFIDKTVGIQDYKDDFSLSKKEIATIAEWVDSGAPQGNPADMPPPLVFTAADKWDIGEPDLIVDTPSVSMKANAPDWWGALTPTPTGLTEDRYVSGVQMKEVSSLSGGTGGRFIFHHAIHSLIDEKGAAAGGDRRSARGWAQRRILRSAGRPAHEGRFAARVPFDSHALEQRRYDRASARRLQVPPEGLQAAAARFVP